MLKIKKQNHSKMIILFIAPLVALLCAGIWFMQTSIPKIFVESETGVYDLRGFDFSETMIVTNRVVEYIPGELLSPEEFEARHDIQIGRIPGDVRVVTMRQHILVPDDRLYAICGFAANFANHIYINGKLLYEEGTPGLTPGDERPKETYHFFTVQPDDGVIEILIQTSSFSHKDVASGIKMNISTYEVIRAHYLRSMAASITVTAWYILMAIIFLTLFIVLPAYKSNLWLALMSIVWAARTGVTGNKALLAMIIPLDWSTGYHIEKASMPIAIIFLMLALHSAFPAALPKWLRRAIVCVAGAMAAAALLLPTMVYSYHSSDVMRVINLIILIILASILLSLRRNKPTQPQLIILTGICLLAFAYLWDWVYNYAWLPWRAPFAIVSPMTLAFCILLLEASMLNTMLEMTRVNEQSKRMELESEKLQEMNRLKSAFYTDMSHEMKTPLTVIAVNAQFAAQNIAAGAVDEETITDLNAISAEAKRLAQMVTGLVGIGRMQVNGGEHLSLSPILTETARIYQSLFARKGNRLEVDIASELPPVEGSADQLIQVLINLLSNANRHTSGGLISIRAESLGNQAKVSVTDNGDGISPELLPHVFERFLRGEKGGSGLGLSICKTIIEEYGGNIGIESEEGSYTHVWFTLPSKEEIADEAVGNDIAG